MKKVVTVFILIILFLFLSMCIMVGIDKNNIKDMEKNILNNTEIEDIVYINKYDDKYIVINDKYLYLFSSKYEEILKIDIDLLHDNESDYALIYRDNKIMYMDNYKNKDGIVFKYYDIYTYELIDEIIVGGN